MKRWIALLLLFSSALARATVLPPQDWHTVTLVDGSQLQVRPVAVNAIEDRLSLAETADGNLVTDIAGRWFRVELSAEGDQWQVTAPLVTTGLASDTPSLIVRPQADVVTSLSHYQAQAQAQTQAPQRTPFRYDPALNPSGFEQPLLIVRVSFDDESERYSDAEVAERFFAVESSVQSYFLENSYQTYRVIPVAEQSGTAGDGIVHVRLPYAHPDFGNGYSGASQALARDVMAALPALVNLSAYDRNGDLWLDPNELALVIMVAGYEQAYAGAASSHPRVWAHKASVYEGQAGGYYFGEYALFGEKHQEHLATIGILCHELGHLLLDLPDLYAAAGNGMGIGRWGLMGLGGWNRVSGYAGERPVHLLAWSKEAAGFIKPQSLGAGVSQVSLQAVSQAGDALEVHLDHYQHGERLILEHRHQSGFDGGLPGSGVLITRVNDLAGFGALSSASGLPLIAVEEADGRDDLASNSNLGEASDVYSSVANQMLFAAEAQSEPAGELQLLDVNTGQQADLELDLGSAPVGDNYGWDDLPPNAVYGSYGGQATIQIEYPQLAVKRIDGIDLFMLGAGQVTVAVEANGTGLVSQQVFSVTQGWNRLGFQQASAVAAGSDIRIALTVSAGGLYAPLAVDAQGMASGHTYTVADGQVAVAPFDASVRLLAIPEAAADAAESADISKSLNAVSVEVSSANESSSGGGSLLWLLGLSAYLLRRRKPLVL